MGPVAKYTCLAALLCSGHLWAVEPPALAYPADLPPREASLNAIRTAPQAQAAEAMVAAEGENRKRLEAGPYEWTARVGSQRRNINGVNGTPNERFREWSAGLERGIRLPGKAAIDEQLGAQGEAMAKVAFGDALHETSRSLLKGWFTWLREKEGAAQWQRQSESLARQRQVTARRVQLGDAPRLELMQAEAAAAQAQAALEQARLRRQVAEADLGARFPGLPLPQQIAPTEPLPLEEAEWREHLLEHNHELMLARAESEQARLVAHRADADRVPDPTLGVHLGSDKGGEERI
ncbi:MAG TPA: TolC family protein, partial [Azospira sp.]|nr:TolC family protein [Azospira sp.]